MALNQVIIMGRITRDLEIKQTQNGISVLQFTVAVNRYAKQGEEPQADFISCVAWRNTAEFVYKYFGKGRMIAVTGKLQTRTYDDKNGTKHYITEVLVDSADFTGEPKPAQNAQGGAYSGGNSYQPAQQNAPQTRPQAAQTATQTNSADFADFDVFSDDGVPF